MAFTVIPFEEITIVSTLPMEEVMLRLVSNIELTRRGGFFGTVTQAGSRVFHGTLRENEFTIQRSITHKNSFLPVIKGHVQRMDDKTHVTMKMRMETGTIVFMCIWLGIVGIVFISSIFGSPSETTIGTGGMLLAGYFIPTLAYTLESSKAKKILVSITKGTILDTQDEKTKNVRRYVR